MKIQTYSLAEFQKFARDFTAILPASSESAAVIALSGNLGAGKTTFAQIVAKELGVEERVASPTFNIQKVYTIPRPVRGFGRLIHIDAYRLHSAEDLNKLGWKELIEDEKNLILVEWPEHVAGALPQSTQRISIEYVDEDSRIISYGA